jgi:hypothetical protein
MLSSSTPFKIHDENADLATAKSISKKGLSNSLLPTGGGGINDSVMKKSKGLMATPMAPKSTRKALGELSNAKLNTIHRTGGNGKSGVDSVMKASKTPKKLSFKLATFTDADADANEVTTNIPISNKYDVDDMICSGLSKNEDIHDTVFRRASEIQVVVAPSYHTNTCVDDDTNSEEDWSAKFATSNVDRSDNDGYEYEYGFDELESSGAVPEFTLNEEEPCFD